MATPEQILETNQLFNLAWPGKSPDDRFLPDGHIAAFIDAGRTPAEISAAFSHGMSVLGFTVDPPGGPTAGKWTGARSKALSGHFTLEDSLRPYLENRAPMPAGKEGE